MFDSSYRLVIDFVIVVFAQVPLIELRHGKHMVFTSREPYSCRLTNVRVRVLVRLVRLATCRTPMAWLIEVDRFFFFVANVRVRFPNPTLTQRLVWLRNEENNMSSLTTRLHPHGSIIRPQETG